MQHYWDLILQVLVVCVLGLLLISACPGIMTSIISMLISWPGAHLYPQEVAVATEALVEAETLRVTQVMREEMQVVNEELRQRIMQLGIHRVPPASQELTEINRRGHYRWQFYLRRVLLDVEAMEAVGDFFWYQYQETHDFQLGGIESAGVPVLMAIISRSKYWGRKVNAFTIRKEPKKYGLQNWIEGMPNDLPVVLVDDLISPVHSAFWAAFKVLRNSRLQSHETCFMVVNKQYAKFDKIETSQGDVKINFMYDLDDLEVPIR